MRETKSKGYDSPDRADALALCMCDGKRSSIIDKQQHKKGYTAGIERMQF